jgi:mRNA interferase HigB
MAGSTEVLHEPPIRQSFSSADGVTVNGKTYTVFNIMGNMFCLITKIEYLHQTIYIKHTLTHAEYDREEWKNK